MIEVLITIFVMSVGLLGLAAMQADALKGGGDSIFRSKAVAYVADITDRIRANTAGLTDYQLVLGGSIASPPDCVANECSPQQMAQYDMSQWLLAMQDAGLGLPGALGQILQPVAPAPAGLLTITVQWTDRLQSGEGAVTPEQYTTEVQF